MATETKAVIRRLIEEIWNKHDLSAVEALIAPNYIAHDPATPETITGIAGFKQFYNAYTTAFPDQHFTIEELVAEGDRVACRWSVEATHTGALHGIEPTGRRIRVTGTTISRIENGKVVEDHIQWDALGLMQQIGVAQRTAGA